MLRRARYMTVSRIWNNSSAFVSDRGFTFARQRPIVVTARRRSFGISNNRESTPTFRCGAAGSGIASI